MKKQVLKGATLLMLIAAVALMAALVSAHAQSNGELVVDIPFGFTVGGKSLEAGEYVVKAHSRSGGGTVLISNRDSRDGAFRLTQSIQAGIVPREVKLVFHRYGQRYFLSEIWTPGDRAGRQLLKSSEELALENQLAAISSRSELAQHSYVRVEIIPTVR